VWHGRSVATVLAGLLVLSLFGTLGIPAIGQGVLDDLVVRSVDVGVTIAPVDLRAEVGPAGFRLLSFGSLRGRARVTLEVVGPQAVSEARFDLDESVTIRSVQAEGGQAAHARRGDIVTVTFSPSLVPGSRVPVTFEYDGQPAFIYNEFILVHAGVWYPMLTNPTRDWSQNLARVSAQITAPQGVTAVTTGRQLSSEGGVTRWDSEAHVSTVALVGGRRHRRVDRTVSGVALQMYVPQGEDRNLDRLAAYTGQAIDFYNRLLYPFPFSQVKVVSLLVVSGGIGYPALMLIDDRVFAGTLPAPFNRESYTFSLMAHEAAHSYVPGQIAPKGIGFVWLSEGFAEYLSLMATEAVLGAEAYARELQEERDSYALIAGTSADRPISVFTFANYGPVASRRVIYSKGSLVLHMLRFVVGDDAFRRTLSTYFQRYRGKGARVGDFREVAEEVSGQTLDWFFAQWIGQVVLPDYVVAAATTRAEGGGFQTTATIRNTGTGRMPVDVAFGTGAARVMRRVEVPSRSEATVTATTPAAVRQVEVDPGKWLIQSNYRNDAFEIR
jgi:hypothetical protein